MATRPATRAIALFTPDAAPECVLSTAPSTAAVSGAGHRVVTTNGQPDGVHMRIDEFGQELLEILLAEMAGHERRHLAYPNVNEYASAHVRHLTARTPERDEARRGVRTAAYGRVSRSRKFGRPAGS
jgi:hypothetical protein